MFIIVLLLIVGSLFVFACYNPDKVPKSVSGVLPTPPPSANNYHHSNQAIYTVQVAATTNRERAFQVKQAFKK